MDRRRDDHARPCAHHLGARHALLSTPAGEAALHILDTNGAELPANLARCRHFVVRGRGAEDYILWAQGPALATRRDPFAASEAALAMLPAWPFAAIALGALIMTIAVATTKTGPRIRRI